MAESGNPSGPGGFVIPTLPSPAPSTTSTTRSFSGLPHPRGHALRPGSAKEDKVRNYIDDRLMYINRRWVKKHGLAEPGDEVIGYKSMGELCKDLEPLINIIWLSGTPSLQIPYLLNIANEFTTWLDSFPPSSSATFSVLRKLDHAFASLLKGRDIETNEVLPGFDSGSRSGMSKTDMVRCRSLVELTRVVIVDVMSRGAEEMDTEEDTTAESDAPAQSESDAEGGRWGLGAFDEDDERLHMDVARVYENTLVQLGEILGHGQDVGDIPQTFSALSFDSVPIGINPIDTDPR